MKESNSVESHDGYRRRLFLNYLLTGGILSFTASIIYPIFRFLIPPENAEPVPTSVVAGTANELKPNSSKIIRFGRKPAILIRTKKGEYRAFTAVCTHLDCTVQYREDFLHIWCACHNGHYDLKGINIAGPPPRPLEWFKVDINEGKVFVSKIT